MADVKDTALELIGERHHFVATGVQVQLCVIRIRVKRHRTWQHSLQPRVQDEEQRTKD